MSQPIATPRPALGSVWQLRRKKVPDEISLPADYVPTDYTSLPPEEPKKKNTAPLVLGLIVTFLLLGAIAYATLFMNKGAAEPTAIPAAKLEITRARMIVSSDKLTTQIEANTDAPNGSEVTATLLENDAEFAFWDTTAITQTVDAGTIKFSIPEAAQHENGRSSAEYKVRLAVNVGGKITTDEKELEIISADRFYGSGSAVVPPTESPTAAPAETPQATEVPTVAPTAEPAVGVKPTPLNGVVVSRDGAIYGSPYGPANQLGTVNASSVSNIVAKLPVGNEVWYLLVVPSTGAAGWVNSSAIDLPASDISKITSVSGDAPYAVVSNGGNVRAAPGGTVVTQVDAGMNVKLVSRLADSSWFQVEAANGQTGWVISSLLTINPDVLATVPVAP